MRPPRAQPDFPPEKTPKFSPQDEIYQHVQPLASNGRDSVSDNTHQITNPDTRLNHRRNNGRILSRVADHPEWSAYLADRHILDPAIAAGAWVEYEQGTGQDVLVWHGKRRNGSPGATRRRLLKPVSIKGKRQPKIRWQFTGQKTDEPFYYAGTLDEFKAAIAAAGGSVYIVEGEVDVWSLHALGIRNVIGIYGITNIPKDIASILDEQGVTGFTYFADNDKAGTRGASKLRTLLHGSGWTGAQEYRKFAGPDIPDKGDANDLLCHHFPDISQARAALDALPKFSPGIEQGPVRTPSPEIDHDQQGWDAVKEAIRIALGVTRFKSNGFSKNIRCPNPLHEDKTPSAAWHKGGYCTCHACAESFNAKQVAEWLGIDWCALRRPQPKIISTNKIDLDAAPQQTETAPLSFNQVPDTWRRLLIKFYKPTEAVLFLYVQRARKAGLLAPDVTRGECIKALRELGCNVSDGAIYKVFQEVTKHDNHPLFVKVDPGAGSGSRYCKFQLRSLEDIERRLMHGIRYRVYESTFHKHRDTLIDFKVFDEALPGSEFTKTLESVLEPLYTKQEKRFKSLLYVCEQKIAAYREDLKNLHTTPLPDWTTDKACELPALLARGIYNAEPEDRSKREWARLLGISEGSVDITVKRAGIQRRADTKEVVVDSERDAKDQARALGAKIVGVKVDGGYQQYDAPMDIPQGSVVVLQPPARHEIVSDEKQIIKAPPAKPSISPATAATTERADNMKQPGNWYKPTWDPKFIYWELVKACCLLHGYQVKDGLGIYHPQTGEIWPNPSLNEAVSLIIGEPADADPADP